MLTFATPGVPKSTPGTGGTIEGIKHADTMGIRAMEMEWVQRVPLNPTHMRAIAAIAHSLSFQLTVHAPYYINLNTPDPKKRSASIKRIVDALSMAELSGAASVCVHAAFYLGSSPEHCLENVRKATDDIMKQKHTLFPHVNLAYETMGKQSQFGTMQEVLTVSKEFGLYPCIDAAHLHARAGGAVNSTKEWNEMFDLYQEYLGSKSLRHMHLHYSGIAYGAKGEKHHVPLQESDAQWEDFLRVLKKREIGGVLVCESPLMEVDTLLLQRTFATI